MANLDGHDDVFDSRDVIARIAELEAIAVIDREPDEQDELDTLYAFADEVDSGEWKFGITFISDDYFESYAREFAEDIGAFDSKANWPLNHIDWEAAAGALIQDYTSFEFHGSAYWAQL